MPWIKKNLMLVLGGLIGFILLGGSGFFLFSEASREGGVNAQLEEKRGEWERLNNLNPYPDDKNIKFVKEEATRVGKLATSLRDSIRPVEATSVTDTFSLKLLIETTISNLRKEADEAGVALPDRYAFTFQKLREMPQFDSNGIPKLAEQVSEVAILCRVLFDAKVHSLDTLRRAPVLREEGGAPDYLTKRGATNQWVVRTPYDLSFKAFSSELAEVIRGFAALDSCISIKTINIEPTTLPPSGGPTGIPMPVPGVMPPGGIQGPGMMDPALRQRYGLGPGGRSEGGGGMGGMDPSLRSRYGLGPGGGDAAMRSRYGLGGRPSADLAPPPSLMAPTVPTAPMGATPSSGPSVVLDEKPLRVILQLDFVKPRPATATAVRRAPRPAPAADADGSGDASAEGASAEGSTEDSSPDSQ